MDLRNHINLIQNHGYNGYIAIFTGPDQLSIQNGTVVLVQNEKIPKELDSFTSLNDIEWSKKYCTIEYPYNKEEIQKNQKEGNGIKTFCTCVGVPMHYLEKIQI